MSILQLIIKENLVHVDSMHECCVEMCLKRRLTFQRVAAFLIFKF